jgi:voltage-gated potassium channel Kch
MKNYNSNIAPCLLVVLFLLCSTSVLHAQRNNMGIGTTSPDVNAILDIVSDKKGLLIPRLTQTQEDGLSGPNGLLIYNTSQNRFNFYNGGWKPVGLWSINGSKVYYNTDNVGIGTSNPLSKLGVAGGLAIGTTYSGSNTAPTNGAIIEGNVGIGNNNPGSKLDVAGDIRTTGGLLSNNGSPTLYLQDTDNRSGFVHVNDGLMYFLNSTSNNSTAWIANGSYWPLHLNLTTDAATFGGPAYFMEGNVGIGTTNPTTAKLVINAGAGNVGLDMASSDSYAEMRVIRNSLNTNKDMHIQYGSSGNLYLYGGNTERITLNSGVSALNGNWDVSGRLNITSSATTSYGPGNYFHGTVGLASHTGGTALASIFAANNIMTGASFVAVSDRRVKKDFHLSIGGNDLASLIKLLVTDYRHIDEVTKGTAFKKGFIAQEVEQVYPEAVELMSDFIPNVYEMAAKTVLADGLLLISLNKKHDFAAGDEVKLIFPDGEKLMTVEATPSETDFSIKWTEAAPGNAFVFGKKVDDFHTVDYDRIFTLNVSATQELALQVELLKKELSAARAENAALRKDMNDRLAKLENLALGTVQK